MARYLALTCEALARPVYAAAAVSPHTVNVRLFKQGLHNRPKGLRVTLQDEIDAVPQGEWRRHPAGLWHVRHGDGRADVAPYAARAAAGA